MKTGLPGWLLKTTGAGLVLLALAWGGIELAVNYYYYPPVPAADFAPPADDTEARRQDLAYFRNYLELDRSYTSATRAEAEAILAQLEPRLDSLGDGEFQLQLARAVAAADNGHSNIWMGRFSRLHGRLPLRLYWFADGLFVVRTHPDFHDLLGARLLSVGGVPLTEAADRLRQFVGGTWEAFRAYRGPALFELPVAHHAAGLSDAVSATTLTFQLGDGSLAVRRLEAQPLAEDAPLYWPSRYLYRELPGEEAEPWSSLAQRTASVPRYLQHPGESYQLLELPGEGLYLQYRNNRGDGIEAFGDSVRRALSDNPVRFLVVDQRFNGGGDYTLTEELMSDLPGLLADDVPIYVVTGPGTFSAGINSVAFLRASAPGRVFIIGERIGDRERIYGETNAFELPNSRLGMTFSTGLHDVENGCPPWPQCYYRNYFHDVAVGKLDPDIAIPTSFADYTAGRDPVLDILLARYH